MEDNFIALLSFVNEAEKYVEKNASKNLGDLSNIDLSKLKKQLAEHISSFDVMNNSSSIEVGKFAFNDYIKNNVEKKKRNVIDELGQIFDVDLNQGIDDDSKAKYAMDEILGNEEVSEEYETQEPVPDKTEDTENIDEVIETIKEKAEIALEEEEKNQVIRKTVKDNDEFTKETSEEIVGIVDDTVGEYHVEEETEEDESVVEEIKDAYEKLDETESETGNDFGLSEDDEVLNTIRQAASGNNVTENKDEHKEQLFQPAPDNLDSIFEEVETNKPEPVYEPAPENLDSVFEEVEKEAETPEENKEVSEETEEIENDLLSSLSGLINYGQFDEKLNNQSNEEVSEETAEEPEEEIYQPSEVHYIVNPLIDESENAEVKETEEKSEETETEENEDEASFDEEIEKEVEEEYVPQYGMHIIENPGLDVVFNNDDVVYSTYDEKDNSETNEPETSDDAVAEENVAEEETPIEETVPQTDEDAKTEKSDENDKYVDNLLSDIEFGGSKIDEIMDAREETYKVISKMYPYLNYAFIKSAFDLKDSIADEYEEGEEIILLHRASFTDVEDLRKYTEVMMNHNYQVNVDEDKMIVDTLKSYVNADGLILNSIFDVANQIALLNGRYEGYCVLTNNDK